MGSGVKSNMRKGFLICDEMLKFFIINEEAFSHKLIYDLAPDHF